MKSSLPVLLLAGGDSTRFWPFEQKNLQSFLGKPLLLWHFEQCKRMGLSQIVVVASSRNIASLKSIGVPGGLSVSFVVQKGKGQAAAVLSAQEFLPDGPVIIMNASDIYDDILIAELAEKTKTAKDIFLSAVTMQSYFPGGYIKFGSAGVVSEIVEKPKEGTQPSDVVRLSADGIPNAKKLAEILKKYGKKADNGYETGLNAYMKIASGQVIQTDTQWLSLKYPWHILSVMDSCLAMIEGQTYGKDVTIKKHVVIEGPVLIEDHVTISEFTKIVGPVYIGKNTIIGNNNIIRRSHIGDSVVTGFNTDITRSYVGSDSWFHSNYIGDSVIGQNVSLGSGSVLANLRLDESDIWSVVKEEKIHTQRNKLGAMIGDDVRIGVNVSIMPGVKIGKGSFVGAAVVLPADLPEGNYCHSTESVTIVPNTKSAVKTREEFRKKL